MQTTRRLLAFTTVAVVVADELNAKTIRRNLRTAYNGAWIAYEYKIRWNEDTQEQVHQRVAQRILHTCQSNGGLYVKFGQGICSMNHVLPPVFFQTLKQLFQDAPSVPFADVEKIILKDFGKHANELFMEFDQEPVASASIAQVHKAKLRDGTVVAVKVQKPYIRAQLDWDMLAYKTVLRLFEYFFELPIYWTAAYTERHLREEVDFIHEGHNAEKAQLDIAKASQLNVYIPKVYWEYTTDRVLTCEWTDGTSLAVGVDELKKQFDVKVVMTQVVQLFAHQIFISGFVHSDPHPGNILIRKLNNKTQVVLLDHGLYMKSSEEFRLNYAKFWRALFVLDTKAMTEVAETWGISDVNVFASATLMRPFRQQTGGVQQKLTRQEVYRMQVESKERVRKFLANSQKIPQELIFIGRNMNLVRANNKNMNSPVNRINILVDYAAQATSYQGSWLLFRVQLLLVETTYRLTQWYKSITEFLTGCRQKGFEDLLDQQMIQSSRQMGIAINEESFSA